HAYTFTLTHPSASPLPTLSLHDALPISTQLEVTTMPGGAAASKKSALESLAPSAHEIAAALHAYATEAGDDELAAEVDFSPRTSDRKSTRLNSSHLGNSYAVFCLKKKNT